MGSARGGLSWPVQARVAARDHRDSRTPRSVVEFLFKHRPVSIARHQTPSMK